MILLKTLLLVSVLSFQIVSAYAKTYLVAVGVSDYPGTDKDLRLPANDAATIQYIYSKNSNVESVLLQNSAATKNAVLSKLQATFSKAKAISSATLKPINWPSVSCKIVDTFSDNSAIEVPKGKPAMESSPLASPLCK